MARTITIAESIKDEIARRVVEQAHPGYDTRYMGAWYVVDGKQVVHAAENRPWDPWNDGAEVISVEDLVNIFGGADAEAADFDPTPAEGYSDEDGFEAAVAFAFNYVPNNYDADAYAARLADERGW